MTLLPHKPRVQIAVVYVLLQVIFFKFLPNIQLLDLVPRSKLEHNRTGSSLETQTGRKVNAAISSENVKVSGSSLGAQRANIGGRGDGLGEPSQTGRLEGAVLSCNALSETQL